MPATATRTTLGYRVSATFDSPQGEHYYGLGQQQQGFMDLRDHRDSLLARLLRDRRPGCLRPVHGVQPRVRADLGQSVQDHVDLGFNQQNVWSSEVGDRVSYFVIAGRHER